MPKWKIHARHTPCPVKQAEVEAATEDAAVQAFVDLNVRSCRVKFKDGWKAAVKGIEEWVSRGGLDGLEVAPVVAAAEATAEQAEGVPQVADFVEAPAESRAAVVETEAPPVVSVSQRRPQQKRKARVEAPAEAEAGGMGHDAGDEYADRPYQATV